MFQVNINTLTIVTDGSFHYYNNAEELLRGIRILTGKVDFEINVNRLTAQEMFPNYRHNEYRAPTFTVQEMFPHYRHNQQRVNRYITNALPIINLTPDILTYPNNIPLNTILEQDDEYNGYGDDYGYDDGYGYDDDYEEDVKPCFTENEFELFQHNRVSNILTEESCSICLDEFKLRQSITLLNCNHLFHKSCAKSWFCNESTRCPMCRADQS